LANKKFFTGMAVLLSASLFFFGCSTDSDDGGDNGGNNTDDPTSTPVTDLNLADAFASPVATETPATATAANDEYTGVITWASADGTALSRPFVAGTAYTATVVLTAADGKTFTGIAESGFTYGTNTVAITANTGATATVTVAFPATQTALELFQAALGATNTNVTWSSNTAGSVTGAVTLLSSATLPAGVTLTVASAGALTVPSPLTLNVAGTLSSTGTGTVATTNAGKVELAHATAATNGANFKWAAEHPGAALALEVTASAEVEANTTASSAVAITVPTSQELSVATGFTLTVEGTFVTTGTGTVATTDTGKIVLANVTDADNTANFVWALAHPGTLLALDLAEDATLGASATAAAISEAITVTLDEDVTLAVPAAGSPVLTVQGVLDATAGTVAVGTDNSVTFAKAHITGDTTTGAVLTGATGVADFAAGDVLILAGTGSIATLGDGTATFGLTEFSGVGVWTASGTAGTENGSDPVNGVKITTAEVGATIAVSAVGSGGGWSAATLTATGTDPVITQALGTGSTLAIGENVNLNVGTVGALVLTGDASNGAQLSGAGNVVLGNASITGGSDGAWQAVGDTTSIKLSSTAPAVAAITGTGNNPKLAALTDDGAAITLATGQVNGNAAAVTVTNATIDISTQGSIVFPWVAETAATLVLKGGTGALGALKLGSGADNDLSANLNLTCGGQAVVISGSGFVAMGVTEGTIAGLISGGTTADDNDATITGQTDTNDVTIKAGATLPAGT
jgi:hypothetical protein